MKTTRSNVKPNLSFYRSIDISRAVNLVERQLRRIHEKECNVCPVGDIIAKHKTAVIVRVPSNTFFHFHSAAMSLKIGTFLRHNVSYPCILFKIVPTQKQDPQDKHLFQTTFYVLLFTNTVYI